MSEASETQGGISAAQVLAAAVSVNCEGDNMREVLWGRWRGNHRVLLAYHGVPRKRQRRRWSSVGPRWQLRGPSRSQLMHHLPFNRMQLWTFPSQRDNEVSSGAENEPVVCPGGSWGLWKQAEPGLCSGRGWREGGISRDTLVSTIDSEPRLPGYTS